MMSLPRSTNSSHSDSILKWLKNEKHILYLFMTYGLLMGVLNYFLGMTYSQTYVPILMFNLPSLIIILSIEHAFFSPFGFAPFYYNPWLIIPGSVLGWAIIGFVPYMIIKFYRFTKEYPT